MKIPRYLCMQSAGGQATIAIPHLDLEPKYRKNIIISRSRYFYLNIIFSACNVGVDAIPIVSTSSCSMLKYLDGAKCTLYPRTSLARRVQAKLWSRQPPCMLNTDLFYYPAVWPASQTIYNAKRLLSFLRTGSVRTYNYVEVPTYPFPT